MVEGGMTCIKYLLFAFNLVFFLFGLALVAVGIYVQVQLHAYLDFFSIGNVNATAILIIVVGVITLIVGFLGCCGAYKEHFCMTMTFAVLIGVILVIEIGGGIAAYVLRGQLNAIVEKGMKTSMTNYKNGTGVKAVWDAVQKDFECCGTNSASDWLEDNLPIPPSCCGKEATSCDKEKAYDTSCLKSFGDFIISNIGRVAAVAVALGVVEMVGIIFACCLARAIKREYDVV